MKNTIKKIKQISILANLKTKMLKNNHNLFIIIDNVMLLNNKMYTSFILKTCILENKSAIVFYE